MTRRGFVIARNWQVAVGVLDILGLPRSEWHPILGPMDAHRRLRGYDQPVVLVIGDVHIGQETRDVLRASRARVYKLEGQ